MDGRNEAQCATSRSSGRNWIRKLVVDSLGRNQGGIEIFHQLQGVVSKVCVVKFLSVVITYVQAITESLEIYCTLCEHARNHFLIDMHSDLICNAYCPIIQHCGGVYTNDVVSKQHTVVFVSNQHPDAPVIMHPICPSQLVLNSCGNDL